MCVGRGTGYGEPMTGTVRTRGVRVDARHVASCLLTVSCLAVLLVAVVQLAGPGGAGPDRTARGALPDHSLPAAVLATTAGAPHLPARDPAPAVLAGCLVAVAAGLCHGRPGRRGHRRATGLMGAGHRDRGPPASAAI